MNGKDKIKDLFAEKLGAHEAHVNPELWNAIASQIGTAATVTSTGLSIVAKTIIGISAASVIGVGAYFITRNDNTKQRNSEEVQHTQLVTEDVAQEDSNNTDEVEARTIDTPPTVDSHKENPEPVIEESSSLSVVSSEAGQQADSKKKGNENPRLSENGGTFTNEPTPNLIGEKPAPVIEQKAPVVEEQKQNKVTENTNKAEIKPEETKASFEITELPNIYVLNANGYFSIGHKGEYSDFQFTIMDKRNNVIFRSDRPDFEWRGTDLYGNPIEPGNYVYIITAKDQKGIAVNKYSNLTVINQ